MELDDYACLTDFEDAYFRQVAETPVDVTPQRNDVITMATMHAAQPIDLVSTDGHVTLPQPTPGGPAEVGAAIAEVPIDVDDSRRNLDKPGNPDVENASDRRHNVAATEDKQQPHRLNQQHQQQPAQVSSSQTSPAAVPISCVFEQMERAFRDEFLLMLSRPVDEQPATEDSPLSKSADVVVPDKSRLRRAAPPPPARQVPADTDECCAESSSSAAGTRQLVCLLTVLEHLAALRTCNRRLQRKCDLLVDGQELLRAQNRILIAAASSSSTKKSAGRGGLPVRASLIPTTTTGNDVIVIAGETRRRASAQVRGGGGPPLTANGMTSTGPSPHRLLSYQGSVSPMRAVVESERDDGARRRVTSGFKLQRSVSVGSMNDDADDSDAADMPVDDAVAGSDSRYRTVVVDQKMSATTSPVGGGSRRERKKSRRLQEKWEQVSCCCTAGVLDLSEFFDGAVEYIIVM